ncbi:MAG: asparagine synthase (glutamine-hydrolyzing) [Candidatus Omnitrophica bacterium]|nr:asparagine synthase (glutamine-hydrolyzing) [Candidatus Omnitrophota bacterium]
MCGIVGFVVKQGEPVPSSVLFSMTRALRHRGPDDEGFALFEGRRGQTTAYAGQESVRELKETLPLWGGEAFPGDVAFGHRRLAIVDVTARGHQPMCDATGRYWIVFNGEIYNWRQLREELEGLGHRFLTASDTEVILNAYRQWGEEALHRFNGEWAFALLDQPRRRIFLSRDRYGIKPLYVSNRGNLFAFASEPKALLRHPGISSKADPDAVFDFLVLSKSNHDTGTFFREIRALEPGGCAVYELDGHRYAQRRYHQLGKGPRASNGIRPAGGTFRDLFLDAVRLRCVSEVPLGVLVSGGVDSSSVAVAARRFIQGPIDAFLGASPQDTEDIRHARQLIDQEGFRPHRVPIEPLPLEELERINYIHDQPIQEWAASAGLWQIHRASSQKLKVCLEGHGADEYLLGYPAYDGAYLVHLVSRGHFKTARARMRWLLDHAYGQRPSALFRDLIRSPLQLIPEGLKNAVDRAFYRQRRLNGRQLLSDSFFRRYGWVTRPVRETFWEGVSLRAAMLRNIYVDRMPYFLHIADRNAMAFSVESRVPFLDHRLLEQVFSRDLDLLVEAGPRKAVLRTSMEGLLPEEIRTRVQKQGMRTWMTCQWFQRHRSGLIDLMEGSPFVKSLVDTRRWAGWTDRNDLTLAERKALWRPVSLALWQRQFQAAW